MPKFGHRVITDIEANSSYSRSRIHEVEQIECKLRRFSIISGAKRAGSRPILSSDSGKIGFCRNATLLLNLLAPQLL
jgi:hypothetical protein